MTTTTLIWHPMDLLDNHHTHEVLIAHDDGSVAGARETERVEDERRGRMAWAEWPDSPWGGVRGM